MSTEEDAVFQLPEITIDEEGVEDLNQAAEVSERHDAIVSVLAQRHLIAHGDSSDITYVRISEYYSHIQDVIDHLADLVLPSGSS